MASKKLSLHIGEKNSTVINTGLSDRSNNTAPVLPSLTLQIETLSGEGLGDPVIGNVRVTGTAAGATRTLGPRTGDDSMTGWYSNACIGTTCGRSCYPQC